MKFSILKKLFALALLQLAIGNWLSAMAQSDLAATTDTNGTFTWPPVIQAVQLSPFTNTIKIYNTNGQLVTIIDNQGNASFLNTNGYGLNINSTLSYFSFNSPFGSLVYSNGEIYNIVAGNSPVAAFGSVTNLQTNVMTLTTALNALSNQMFNMFSATDSVYQAAFRSTNITMLGALASTNSYTSNVLAQIINANWINMSNWIALQGLWQTNNTTNSAGITFAAGSNYVNSVSNLLGQFVISTGTSLTNLFLSTNAIAAHFRFGSIMMNVSNQNLTTVTFSPPFIDPIYQVFISPVQTPFNGDNASNPQSTLPLNYEGTAFTFQSFSFDQSTNWTSTTSGISSNVYNYMLYHP